MSDARLENARKAFIKEAIVSYSYVFIWIALSATVIMYNKYILTVYGFPYPVALTVWHMFFCSTIAFIIVKLGYVKTVDMSSSLYLKAVVPIGALYAGTLWLGNAAYLYLSVSFIQMLKALMPVCVFVVGCGFGTEKYDTTTLLNMIVVTIGVAIASYGEINFVLIGVILQLTSLITESSRLTLVQILLQSRGLKLNPITSLYYVAPCCLAFLLVPFLAIELPTIRANEELKLDPFIFLSNATAAFGLNMAVFLLIGKTSALTMNIAGVVKDWMLIGLSVALFNSPVTAINLGGYGLAFLAVCWYNSRKMAAMKKKMEAQAAVKTDVEVVPTEKTPLMNNNDSGVKEMRKQ